LIDDKLHITKAKLKVYFGKKIRTKLIADSILLCSYLLAVLFLLVVLESFLLGNIKVRTYIFIGYFTLFVFSFGYLVLSWISSKLRFNYLTEAKKVGEYLPDIKDELLDVLQLTIVDKNNPFVIKAFNNLFNKIEKINFVDFINTNILKKRIVFLFQILGVILVLFLLFPSLYSAAERLIYYDKAFTPTPKYSFFILPGNYKVTKGESVNFSVEVNGSEIDKIFFYYKFAEESEFSGVELKSLNRNKFIHKITKVHSDLEYFVKAENVESEHYKITIINKPFISGIDLLITPPQYTKLTYSRQKDNGNISVLKGSKVELKVLSSKELKNGYLLFDDTVKVNLKTTNSVAEGSFTVKQNGYYQIIIEDKQGNKNDNPIKFDINVIEDNYPEIEIISPNKDVNLPQDNKLALIIKIKDDFGFSKLSLNYKLVESKFADTEELTKAKFNAQLLEIDKNNKEQEVYYIWNLSPLLLAVEDVLSYYIEVFDNDSYSGPKSVKSNIFRIRVPGLDEVFADADKLQNEAEKKLTELYKEAEKLNKELDKISDVLKKDKKDITWEEKEQIKQAAEKFDELSSKAEEIKQKLAETQNKLEDKNLLSKETLEKYMELQKLMNELTNEEMQKAFEKLNQVLKNMNRDQVQAGLEDLKKNEELFKKSIERTLNLLKRMKIEQKIDELTKRTENLEQRQNELNEKTENANLNKESDKQELQKMQEDISKDAKEFEEELKKLQKEMEELKDMPKDEMDKAVEESEKQDNEQLSNEINKDLQQNQKSSAMQKQKQFSKNMQKMNKMMQQMKQSMQMQNQMQVYADMLKLIDNIIYLSKEQEKIKNLAANLPYNSQKFNDLIRKQSNIQSDLDRISAQMNDLAQKTFAISPEMGKALGEARINMNSAMQSLQGKNGFAASQSTSKAMGNLNQAAMMMKSMLDQMMNQSGGQGGGMMSMMQQFKQLSQQQMSLNQQTMQMMQQGMQDMQQMQRLAAQQEMIKKSLEELNKEAKESGQSKKLAANTEKILNEMNEVISNLRTQKDVDENIVKKQDKILSRLLDAQRSINDRDFEKEREANTGKNRNQNSPDDKQSAEENNIIFNELIRASKEGYSKDYEELIKKYYEELLKNGVKK
jgi:hypothetical protein